MIFLTAANANLVDLGYADAAVIAVLGYAVVFLGLILLMLVVMALGKVFTLKDRKKAAQPVVEAPAAEVPKATAPGAAGELKLNNVDPKTAAMLMAIVADKMGKPINELRFISIKEVN